jgi:DNA-nicking Smr family endonuclease
MSKGKRQPTGDELQLWQKVTETVAPLAKEKRAPKKKKPVVAAQPRDKPPEKARPSALPKPPPRKVAPPRKAPALNPFDRRTLGRIVRGTVAIDARIDLHGMTQEAAERRLLRFLAGAQAGGAKLVLVITGKGKTGGSEGGERGVLRRVVPMWLASPRLRPIVVGFDEAGPTHGGGGALYVRLRRAGKASARA